jgi:two-component system sensor histidine kinase DctS
MRHIGMEGLGLANGLLQPRHQRIGPVDPGRQRLGRVGRHQALVQQLRRTNQPAHSATTTRADSLTRPSMTAQRAPGSRVLRCLTLIGTGNQRAVDTSPVPMARFSDQLPAIEWLHNAVGQVIPVAGLPAQRPWRAPCAAGGGPRDRHGAGAPAGHAQNCVVRAGRGRGILPVTMTAPAPPAGSPAAPPPASPRSPRLLLWVALVMLLLVAQSLLVVLTLRYEHARAQERTDDLATAAQGEIRRRAQLMLQGLQGLQTRDSVAGAWQHHAEALLRGQREIGRIERRDARLHILELADSPFRAPLFQRLPRAEMGLEAEVACGIARRLSTPAFSRSQFVPMPGGMGFEVVDVCVPVQQAGELVGFTVATLLLSQWLDEARGADTGRSHELSFIEGDGTRLARSGAMRGAGVYLAERVVDLPGSPLQLRVDAAERAPSLIPNLAVALVLGLSIALFVVVLLLVRDGRRRATAEEALAESLGFRKAMEDSLLTGLRARDRQGRIVYVNPAFCRMVGFSADELQHATLPPYWPPERVADYQRRQAERQAAPGDEEQPHEGYETVFMRKDGERFPVMIYEAPLVTGTGKQTGWMSAVLDLSAQRQVEELSRQQQERLQATARLASVGEMASLLSHELNQPLSAIASYATGSLNLMAAPVPPGADPEPAPDPDLLPSLRHALERIAEQAERAGRVIKSVHDFMRRRHQAHEVIAADLLIESVLPLVRLQARKSGARVVLDIAQPVPRVRVERTMVEQVLLNLARNGIQAMEADTPLADRVLTLRVRLAPGPADAPGRWVVLSVIDAGPGIPAAVAQRLFTPFFTTKPEGMGLGLSLCRTVVEQHGGAMDFDNLPPRTGNATGAAGGAEFRFTLPLLGTRAPAG